MYNEQAKSPCSPDIPVVQMGEVQTQVDPLGEKATGQFPNLSIVVKTNEYFIQIKKQYFLSLLLQLVHQKYKKK